MAVLDDVQALLGVDDPKLATIVALVGKRLISRIGEEKVPEELEYIVTEVSVIRYNRIGSEGASSHTVEGESISFIADDFSAYEDDIKAWLDARAAKSQRKVRFL